MFTIIGLMLTGMLLGFLLRKQKLSGIHKVITVLIWLLLFLLGIDVGGNQKIINGLHTIGSVSYTHLIQILPDIPCPPHHNRPLSDLYSNKVIT